MTAVRDVSLVGTRVDVSPFAYPEEGSFDMTHDQREADVCAQLRAWEKRVRTARDHARERRYDAILTQAAREMRPLVEELAQMGDDAWMRYLLSTEPDDFHAPLAYTQVIIGYIEDTFDGGFDAWYLMRLARIAQWSRRYAPSFDACLAYIRDTFSYEVFMLTKGGRARLPAKAAAMAYVTTHSLDERTTMEVCADVLAFAIRQRDTFIQS